VDRGVIATASELFDARHFPGVVAVCSDALEEEPESVELLVMRARAHIGLRRDLDAQADLRDIIRLDPQCGLAYRLLGELAARRDENESAAIFFREALRLDPADQAAADWLQIVHASVRPAKKHSAPAAAAGRFPVTRAPVERGRTATGGEPAHRTLSSPARSERPGSQPRFARGTQSPDRDERTTKPFARGSDRNGDIWKTPAPAPMLQPAMSPIRPTPLPLPPPPNLAQPGTAKEPIPRFTITGRPPTQPPAAPTKIPSRPITRSAMPELPGFAEYLVTAGILSRERLRAAQAYQRSMKVQLSTAIVTLGLATPQRIEWASVAHQSQLARERQQQA